MDDCALKQSEEHGTELENVEAIDPQQLGYEPQRGREVVRCAQGHDEHRGHLNAEPGTDNGWRAGIQPQSDHRCLDNEHEHEDVLDGKDNVVSPHVDGHVAPGVAACVRDRRPAGAFEP